jgi:hypothetical protein
MLISLFATLKKEWKTTIIMILFSISEHFKNLAGYIYDVDLLTFLNIDIF